MSDDPSMSESVPQSKKTRSVTFRLDSSVIDELQAEADNREISLNVLVNQILKRYSEWGVVVKFVLTTSKRYFT